jgi:predicted O-methyltransferase YrrM
MQRTDIINYLAKKNNAQSYLEIGVRIAKNNFDKINIRNKIGIDPGVEGVAEATHTMTSDEFFEKNNQFFDIVFIDGLHESTQVERDINNSLNYLNRGGYIVCRYEPVNRRASII